MVRRRRSYDHYGKADRKVTYSGCNAAGFAAAVPSTLPRSVAVDPCHDRDSIPPFRSGASKDVYGVRETEDADDVREKKADRG
jgi:hypothetical protein